MFSNQSLFRSHVPTAPRLRKTLACMLRVDGTEVAAVLVDIGYGGLRGVLPATTQVPLQRLREVEIAEIGRFDVALRWRRGQTFGCAFRNRLKARAPLRAYFHRIGEHPV